jgi:chromosome segregation ATPase
MSSQPVPFSWQQVDETLANLMLAEVSTEFGDLLREDTQHIRYQNIGNGNGLTVPLQRLEMHRLRTDELAARYYAVYCEVWRSQQKPLTPDFLRAICPNRLRVLVAARVNGVSSEFSLEQMRTHGFNVEWLKSAMEEFKRSMDRLYARWAKLAEIDAKGLEHLLAAAPNSPDVDTVATEVVHARVQLRIVEARLASIEARIASCELALSATQLRQPDNYRIKSLEQRLEGLKADKKQFELRRDDWQRSQDTALRRSAELRRQNVSNPFFDEEIQGVAGELQSREQEYRVEPSANPEPNCAGTVGPEREIAQARERVRHFEAEIAAVDTKIAAFQQSLTEAIVRGTSTFKPRDIDKAIRKLHADKKELEFRRDDWNIILNSVLNRVAGERKPDIAGQPVSSIPPLRVEPTIASKAAKLNYRSELKRVISLQFARNPKASDLEICRALDADGAVELPASWTSGENRLFERAYKDPQKRRKLENTISRVRRDMRNST